MRIAHITDLHLYDELSDRFQINTKQNIDTILGDILIKNIDLVVFTGDYGSYKGMNYLASSIKKLSLKCIFCLGNHDSIKDMLKSELIVKYDDVEKSEEIESTMIITIDSSKGILGTNQISRISNSIKDNKINCIFTHYPILESNKPTFDKEIGIKNKDEIMDVLVTKYEAKIFIFAGHYHTNDYKNKENIVQIINPGALMQINEKDNRIVTESFKYGYNIIEVVDNEIKYETILFEGNGVDI